MSIERWINVTDSWLKEQSIQVFVVSVFFIIIIIIIIIIIRLTRTKFYSFF